jgi:Tfp pilus assembly protein PilX
MKIRRWTSPNRSESGVAMIVALLSLLIVSTLAAGLMYSTQSEIWTTSNYRTVTEARYIAEAGAQQASYWLWQNRTALDLNMAAADVTTFPVTSPTGSSPCATTAADCVVLAPATIVGIADTYASHTALDTSFIALSGTNSNSQLSTSGMGGTPTFQVALQLLSARLDPTITTADPWVTTWKVISQGTVGKAKVQVVQVVENKTVPTVAGGGGTSTVTFKYGAFANSTGCNAITISGGTSGSTTSYNSSLNVGVAAPTANLSGGDLATLGNVSITGGTAVNGSVFAPRYNIGDPNAKNGSTSTYYPYGVAGGPVWPYLNATNASIPSCATLPIAVDEDNNSGDGIGCINNASCTQKASQLPSTITSTSFPAAIVPDTVTAKTSAATGLLSGTAASGGAPGSSVGNPYPIPPSATGGSTAVTSLGQVNLAGGNYYTVSSGRYYFDTLTIQSGATLNVVPSPTGATGAVEIYIMNSSATPVAIPLQLYNSGAKINSGGDPDGLSFIYNGNQTVHIGQLSSNNVFATVYAPNATINFDGSGNIFGAVIGNVVNLSGSGRVIYDTHLANEPSSIPIPGGSGFTLSPYYITEFSWSAF